MRLDLLDHFVLALRRLLLLSIELVGDPQGIVQFLAGRLHDLDALLRGYAECLDFLQPTLQLADEIGHFRAELAALRHLLHLSNDIVQWEGLLVR